MENGNKKLQTETMFWRKKQKKETLYINDDLFGKLTFVDDSGEENYWIGAVEFENETIDIYIYGDASGIHTYQKNTFAELKKRYHHMIPLIESFLTNKLKDRFSFDYSISKDFRIDYISIFKSDNHKLEFIYEKRGEHYWYEIMFEDFKPVDFGISA